LANPFQPPSGRPKRPSQYKDFSATELYCPRCKRAVPVRTRLLLVLPQGDQYEYRCAFCGESLGTKIDKTSPFPGVLK
jgi:transcription elongation factor Elf1